jgi:microcystin-dependent protein
MKIWPTATPPTGWLLCDGSAISRTTYAALFALIGTTYGVGNGSTTFNIPDFRGRFPLGVSGSHALASTGGAETHTLTEGELPSHTHTYEKYSTLVQSWSETIPDGTGATASGSTGSAGSGQAHNNMPPFLTINFIIFAM